MKTRLIYISVVAAIIAVLILISILSIKYPSKTRGYDDGYQDGYYDGSSEAEIYYSDEIDFYNACHSFLISKAMIDAPTVKFGDWFEACGYTMNVTFFNKTINDEEMNCLRLSVKMKNGQSSFIEEESGNIKLNIQSAYGGIFRYDEKENKYYFVINLTDYFFPSWTDDVFIQKDNIEYAERPIDISVPNTLYIFLMSDDGQVTEIILKGE